VRGRVQAATVDAAARLVMRSHSLDFADSASIWLLGRFGVPTLRCGVRCRVPRVPLGVHRLSGECYPFVTYHDGQALPFTPSLDGMARYLIAHAQRVSIPPSVRSAVEQPQAMQLPRHTHTSITKNVLIVPTSGYRTIAEWCAAQEPFSLIGRYITLDRRGVGHCPFTEQHKNGYDRRPSFRVYEPALDGGCCWHCYACNLTGNVFNFLERYHGLSARELWRRILAGEPF
jgi:hypothetical protein